MTASLARSTSGNSGKVRGVRLAVHVLCLCGLALVLPVGVQASKVVYFFFGSDGTAGGQFSSFGTNFGQTPGPAGVAVNTSGEGTGVVAGDVYAVDRESNRVEQFRANGTFVRAFGLNVGGAGVNVCTSAPSCQAGAASSAAGGMNLPQGVAIDQASGNVFVTDQANRRVDVFGANGSFQGAFGWGVDTGAAAFEFCTAATVCQGPNTTAPTGGQAGKFGATIGYPAVDPTNGNLLVASPANRRVDRFSFTLNGSEEVTAVSFVHAFGWGVDTGAAAFQVCTVASTCQAPAASGGNAGQFATATPTRVAADSTGAVYTVEPTINFRVQKFTVAGNVVTPLGTFAAAHLKGTSSAGEGQNNPTDIAIGPSNNVFVAKVFPAETGTPVAIAQERRILEVDSAGTELLDTHMANAGINSVNGISMDAVAGSIFVASTTGGPRVYVLIDPPDHPPVATTGDIGPGLADHLLTLEGSVNPEEFKVSECYFEYGLTTEYGSITPCVPGPEALGEGTATVPVTASTEPLEPSATYHYRLVASNVGITDLGEDRTFTTEAASSDGCPNAARRLEQGIVAIQLPACMALEMVSPPQKGGQAARSPQISADGNRVRFNSLAALAGTPGNLSIGGDPYVATRGGGGWTTSATTSSLGLVLGWGEGFATAESFSPDFSDWFQLGATLQQQQLGVSRAFQGGLGGFTAPLSPPLVPISQGGQSTVQGSELRGASADHSHLYFVPGPGGDKRTAFQAADPEPNGQEADRNTYVAYRDEDGQPDLDLLARDHDGKVWGGNCGSRLGGFRRAESGVDESGNGSRSQGAVSADGSRVYFSTRPDQPAGGVCDPENKLRILERRESGQGVWIGPLFTPECNRLDCSPADGDDLYQGASVDGSRVYFTSTRQLTDSDTDGGSSCNGAIGASEGCDLYLYDTARDPGERLVQVSDGSEEAKVLRGATAVSGDGSHAYFVAQGALTADPNPEGDTAISGAANLYAWELASEALSFLGTLSPEDRGELWDGEGTFRNGAYPVPVLDEDGKGGGAGDILLFQSSASLTDDDLDGGFRDVFRYDSGAEELVRVSKAAPAGSDNGPFDVEAREINSTSGVGTDFAEMGRWVSEDGNTVALLTAEALAPGDVNGARDFYMSYEDLAIRLPGRAYISTQSNQHVVSHDGSAVAFQTFSRLLPEDGDSAADVYLARVEGGFQSQAAVTPCDPAVDCRPAPPLPPAAPEPKVDTQGNPPDCAAPQQKAQELSRRAKRLRHKAKKTENAKRAKQMRKEAKRLSKQANDLSRNAKRCRQANGGAGK